MSAVGNSAVNLGGVESTDSPYLITEDSPPAKLGSSLGWILQLDGDPLRDAFLNAPWVKAVIPIRPLREWRALKWLSDPRVEGADGLDGHYEAVDDAERGRIVSGLGQHTWDDPDLAARYASLEPDEITVLDALRFLILRVQAKHRASAEKISDPENPEVGFLPLDRVYENGFDPLVGGFVAEEAEPFEVFDQWITVVPTDQNRARSGGLPPGDRADAPTGLGAGTTWPNRHGSPPPIGSAWGP